MKKAWGATAVAVAAGLVMAAVPGAAHAAERTIVVPGDFVKTLSDTRATGHYEVVGSGLRIYTTGSTSTDKVAEYVASNAPLAVVGEPSLDYSNTFGTIPPGFQLVVDYDADGTADGILIGEKVYNGDWWASSGSKQFVKDAAPSHDAGSGSANHGTLDQWRASFPSARVLAFGFSLGSGVYGDWTINAISYAGDRYTFSDKVPDTTPPVVTCDVAAPGPSFGYGTPGQVTASVTDAGGSGVSAPTLSAAVDTGSLGARTVTLTATDDAGNVGSADCAYTVVVGAPASVTVVSGSGQTAPVGTAFAQPVKVRVADAGDNPVANVPVTFTAPTTGASGSFMGGSAVTDDTGTAAVTVTATGGTGTWTGSASVTGVSKAATFSLTNTAAPAKRADLRVTLTGPAQLSRGQAGSYVLTVTNVGPDAATDVLSSLALPCGVSITSTGGGARVGNLVVWPTVKSLASGSSTTYTVTVKATAKGTWKAVGGAASLKTADPALANNLAATTVSVR